MQVLLASIYPYLFLLLYFTIPFDEHFRALPNILLIVLGVTFPFVVKKSDFLKLRRVPTVFWALFFAAVLLQTFLHMRLEQDWVIVKKILLVGGLVLLYLPVQGSKKLNHAIIFSSLAAIVYSCVKLPIMIHQGVTFNFLETGSIIEALLIDRVYLGLLSVLSILASYQLLRKEYDPANKYYLGIIVLNVLFILLIVSRIAIISLVAIFLLSLFYSKKRGPQLLFFAGFLALTVMLIFLFNNDLRKQFFYNNSDHHKEGLVANTLALEPRTVIWGCAWDLAQREEVPMQGLGFTETNGLMMDCYENTIDYEKKKEWFLTQKYNIHNQFLDLYVGAGALVILSFILGLLMLFLKNRKRFYPTALLLTLCLFLVVENMFHRQIGAYYVGFVLLMLLINNESTAEKVETGR